MKCFLRNKSELTSKVMPIIEMICEKGYNVKYICMDNAGENKSLAAKVKSLGITVEYVAPNTAQHDGVVERAFVVGASRGCAIISELKLSEDEKKQFWAECFNFAATTSNLIPFRHKGETNKDLYLHMSVFMVMEWNQSGYDTSVSLEKLGM